MAKESNLSLDEDLNLKSVSFIDKIESEMQYSSDISSGTLNLQWVNEIDFACPYIDNIVRNPKLALIKEEDTVKIEKAKKITVSSIRDLSRNTQYIEKIDEKTDDVQPSKILIERSEETFNIYENRLVYTLINNLSRFIMQKEEELDNFKLKNDKMLEYVASTTTGSERVKIEFKISSNETPRENNDKNIEKEILNAKKKIKKVKAFLTSWQRSDLIKTLDKLKVPLVNPPIKKTNLILKNPNFQVATKLWDFLQGYSSKSEETKEGFDTDGNGIIKSLIDDTFLMNYFVLDSISPSKKEQKAKLAQYAIVMINQQIERIISLLLDSGISISEDEILAMITEQLKKANERRIIDNTEIRNKFKNEFEEYLRKSANYL